MDRTSHHTVSELVIIDRIGLPEVVEFIRHQCAVFDMKKMRRIYLSAINYALLNGCCTYPTPTHDYYRIRAGIRAKACDYPLIHQHWGRIADPATAQGWRSGAVWFNFKNVREAAVHLLAHELFHYFLREKQVPEKNTEANCNHYADQWLAAWRSMSPDA